MKVFHERLRVLCESLRENCAPFEPHFVGLIKTSNTNDIELTEPTESTNNLQEAKILKKISQLNSQVLKVVETLYKKYLDGNSESLIKKISSENAGSFALECLANFVKDVEIFDPKSINRLLEKLATSVSGMIRDPRSRNIEFMQRLVSEFRVIKAYVDLFVTFATKW